MIRITKLLALTVLILTVACEQTDTEEPQIILEEAVEINDAEIETYPVMIFDKLSALAQQTDCEEGIGSYICGSVLGTILERTEKNSLFVVPRRPRHCPMTRCGFNSEEVAPTPKVPGTICEPLTCDKLLTDNCLELSRGLKFAVKAASLENVAGYLISGNEVITSTDSAYGGSISEGFECNSAQLNFGIPIAEIAERGMWILVETDVEINEELVSTSFKIQL